MLELNLILHPPPPSEWQSARFATKVLVVVVAIVVFGLLVRTIGYDKLRVFGDPKLLMVFAVLSFALVVISYVLEFLRNRSWSRTFSSTVGKLHVRDRTLSLDLALISHGEAMDDASASAEILLRWRNGMLRWGVFHAAMKDVVVAQHATGDSTRWSVTGTVTSMDPLPDALASVPVECDVGVTLRAAGRERTRILAGR